MSRSLRKILGGEPKLKVRILSPTQVHYDGPAVVLSAVNQVGPFDILADHANFFSLLSPGNIVVNTGGAQPITIPVTQGIIKVKNNTITLFVDLEPSIG